jgi:hypothetical protein
MICIIVEADNADAAVDIDFHALVDDFDDFYTDNADVAADHDFYPVHYLDVNADADASTENDFHDADNSDSDYFNVDDSNAELRF